MVPIRQIGDHPHKVMVPIRQIGGHPHKIMVPIREVDDQISSSQDNGTN